jgi:hypothetical protein
MLEFTSQSKLVRDSFGISPTATQTRFAQLIKGAELMLHPIALMSSRITELEEQVEEVTKRKSRKRKRIQQGGTMEYGEGAAQVAAKASMALSAIKEGS